ncbi:GNAT family N-acetyltransferase [Aeromonas veronii]|uniref:GNAT family N-acetyltransferase n=1 Tax=Aeromonas veronii TaxID=654 RepID=UPI001E310643|nr:GNAT family N-acetyltransferase [Aeromonas veronii]MCD6617337.1 GNAT family N-acetyltransferase [Aeromonas veronii]
MIHPLSATDLDAAVELWYQASVQAHDFIPAAFWHEQRAAMQDIYLPASKSWVYEEDGQLLGFITRYQGSVAALFISPDHQHGLGRQLLERLKAQYDRFELTVYAENERARRFYSRNGFKEGEQKLYEHSGHSELVMHWRWG